MALPVIDNLEDLEAAIDTYFATPRRPALKGEEAGVILQMMRSLLMAYTDAHAGDGGGADVAPGGAQGQILAKISNSDFAIGWVNQQDISGKRETYQTKIAEHLPGFNLVKQGVVIPRGAPGSTDDLATECPNVNLDHTIGKYRMLYTGYQDYGTGNQRARIHWASSTDKINWTKHGVLFEGTGVNGDPDSKGTTGSHTYYENGLFYIYYIGLTEYGYEGGNRSICLITTPDFITFTRHGAVITPNAAGTGWRSAAVWHGNLVKNGNKYYFFFNATNAAGKETIGYATSTDKINFVVDDINSPILNVVPGSDYESNIVGDPFVYKIGNVWYMTYFGVGPYRADEHMATTTEALFPLGWVKFPTPILSPGESYDSAYAHKPDIYFDNSGYYHYYTAVSADPAIGRQVALATEGLNDLQGVLSKGNTTSVTQKSTAAVARQLESAANGYVREDILNNGARRFYTAFVAATNTYKIGYVTGNAGSEVEHEVLEVDSAGDTTFLHGQDKGLTVKFNDGSIKTFFSADFEQAYAFIAGAYVTSTKKINPFGGKVLVGTAIPGENDELFQVNGAQLAMSYKKAGGIFLESLNADGSVINRGIQPVIGTAFNLAAYDKGIWVPESDANLGLINAPAGNFKFKVFVVNNNFSLTINGQAVNIKADGMTEITGTRIDNVYTFQRVVTDSDPTPTGELTSATWDRALYQVAYRTYATNEHIGLINYQPYSKGVIYLKGSTQFYFMGNPITPNASGRTVLQYDYWNNELNFDTNGTLVPEMAPAISTQPTDQNLTEGDALSIPVVFAGAPMPTVQWQYSADNITFANIGGATSAPYAKTSVVGDTGYYRAVVSNTAGSVTSNAVHVVVAAALVLTNLTPTAIPGGWTVDGSNNYTGSVYQQYMPFRDQLAIGQSGRLQMDLVHGNTQWIGFRTIADHAINWFLSFSDHYISDGNGGYINDSYNIDRYLNAASLSMGGALASVVDVNADKFAIVKTIVGGSIHLSAQYSTDNGTTWTETLNVDLAADQAIEAVSYTGNGNSSLLNPQGLGLTVV